MSKLNELEIWFVTGSQHLYGEETLKKVGEQSRQIAASIHQAKKIAVNVIFKPVVKSPEEISALCQEANNGRNCIGIITWMHTFSPAKMWIGGLKNLQKPLLHLHTQFNRDIPWNEIDMNFMNLNQSAHGDREFGHIMSRMRLKRKVVVGYWQDPAVLKKIDSWARAAAAWNDWQGAKFVRFGDNMRQVAVTDGDKVEAEMQFGYSVNTHGVNDLIKVINAVGPKEIDTLCKEYEQKYILAPELSNGRQVALFEAAKIEIGLRKFLEDGNYKGFTNTFEDLGDLPQLPGIAVQRLMHAGYGFAAEGDWKTAALVRAMKVMGSGLKGGISFMEDYTYHFEPGNEMVLGAHMLEICESIAEGTPSCEIHPLGIGGKGDPVRLVFNVAGGPALNASMIDMGNRFRLIVHQVIAVRAMNSTPKLPVAKAMWKPLPEMQTGCAAWILAGGSHHTSYSQNVTAEHLEDFAEIAGIEYVLIGNNTNIHQLKNELRWNEMCYQLGSSFTK